MSTVPWIPSPKTPIEYLKYALGASSNDVVLDLGCGDGRVLLEFAKAGAKTICIEINRVLCNVSELVFGLHGLKDRLIVICSDFFSVDLSELRPRPTIVYAYLYPSTLELLSEKLEKELDLCTIIATLDFPIRNWSPVFVKSLVDENGHHRTIWIYINGFSNPKARLITEEKISLVEQTNYCPDTCKRKLFL
ncbi:class I SAM-dependent methyltransferase [Ignisphaera sp. 4213-co]|uniref:Class I SAM-dependent methyltransferase n=1 Tax=Ignisphaera cupida TaxID=3050454 RepID=A0ABD4Z3Z6_9CREN|nr:class I SAM-dependent methyltransferase [Ignisphaera sp. 4213-co]MDK6028046.1 class I SAM-dependent methyltransferase [Ignisphaera sp. 4213-co]